MCSLVLKVQTILTVVYRIDLSGTPCNNFASLAIFYERLLPVGHNIKVKEVSYLLCILKSMPEVQKC